MGHYNNIYFNHHPNPIDKIYIGYKGEIHFSWLFHCLQKGHLPPKAGYSTERSGIFLLPNGAQITIYAGKKRTQVQINPTQWDSYAGLLGFLRRLFGKELPKTHISALHIHVDTKFDIEELRSCVKFHRKSKGQHFAERVEQKSYSTESATYMIGFGTKAKKYIVLYDKSGVEGRPTPCTRVEIRYTVTDACRLKCILDLPLLRKERRFSPEVGFNDYSAKPKLTQVQRKKVSEFEAYKKIVGLGYAVKEMRKKYSNFDRDFQNLFFVTPKDVDLDGAFTFALDYFLNQKISHIESLISDTKNKIEDIVPIFNSAPTIKRRRKIDLHSQLAQIEDRQKTYIASMYNSLNQLSGLIRGQLYLQGLIVFDELEKQSLSLPFTEREDPAHELRSLHTENMRLYKLLVFLGRRLSAYAALRKWSLSEVASETVQAGTGILATKEDLLEPEDWELGIFDPEEFHYIRRARRSQDNSADHQKLGFNVKNPVNIPLG